MKTWQCLGWKSAENNTLRPIASYLLQHPIRHLFYAYLQDYYTIVGLGLNNELDISYVHTHVVIKPRSIVSTKTDHPSLLMQRAVSVHEVTEPKVAEIEVGRLEQNVFRLWWRTSWHFRFFFPPQWLILYRYLCACVQVGHFLSFPVRRFFLLWFSTMVISSTEPTANQIYVTDLAGLAATFGTVSHTQKY